ncbi:MAG: hypothetical protein U0470_00440 [Anaerolineae bacterium]
MIDHGDGYVSFYVPARALAARGQPSSPSRAASRSPVQATCTACYSSPHLHLEVRDRSRAAVQPGAVHRRGLACNLLLVGSDPQSYERDLSDPRRWQSFDDQPPIDLGGELLNDFAQPYPSGDR